ncbi:transporter substrate-binding domain-containing protein [bacterium]|nr:transporter substrate-binding domain-containing protein [bacterium]
MRIGYRLWLIFMLLFATHLGHAQAPIDGIDEPLTIAIKETAPFAMKDQEGNWVGISVELWESITDRLGLDYSFREMDLQEMIDSLSRHEVDGIVGALTITPEREAIMDFTHSFYNSGLGIAVEREARWGWLGIVRRFFSLEFLQVLSFLVILLLFVGLLVWIFERKENHEQFGGGTLPGLLSGMWWSAVTMTTVGYGDKTPVTMWGRCVALVWMFASIVVISSITAAITSSLTVNQLQTSITSPDDLTSVRTATVEGSTSEAYLDRHLIWKATHTTAREAVAAVVAGQAKAAVYDAPILQHLVMNEFDTAQVLPFTFERQDYGFALFQDCPYREQVNLALLEVTHSAEWKEILFRYLGENR